MSLFGFLRFHKTMSDDDMINALNSNFNQIEVDSQKVSQSTPYNGGAVGDIIMTLKTTPTANRLLMDGGVYNKVDYPDLWNLQATHPAYFASSTTTTFTLADMRGRVPAGYKSSATEFDTLGETGGQMTVMAHAHNITVKNDDFNWTGTSLGLGPTFTDARDGTTVPTSWPGIVDSAGSGPNNMNPYLTVNYEVIAKLR